MRWSKKFKDHCPEKFKLNKHCIRTLTNRLILLMQEITRYLVMHKPKILHRTLRMFKSNYNSRDNLRLTRLKSRRSLRWYRPKTSKLQLKLLSLSMTTKRSKGFTANSTAKVTRCESAFRILRKNWRGRNSLPWWWCPNQELVSKALREKHHRLLQAATGNNRHPWYLSQAIPPLVKKCQNRFTLANQHR